MQLSFQALIACLLAFVDLAAGLSLDTNDQSSIFAAQKLVAKGLMDYYNGNDSGQVPGMFVYGYYWWEAGVAWGSLMDYTYYTGDTQYESLIKSSMLFQIGDGWAYLPANQSNAEGNDDQAFWGIAAMQAAELNFSAPVGNYPSWLYLAQAVFNTMAWRWETQDCGGGLRWQIYQWNSGYDYKNSVANGCLFNLAARLARYTGNQSYVDWAIKTWDWLEDVGFLAYPDGPNGLAFVYDGAYMENNCSQIRKAEWTYCYGLLMSGAAFLYNYTSDDVWISRLESLWKRASTALFRNQIMFEAACQPYNTCNTDQRCFKGIFSRFLGLTMLMAPQTKEWISSYIVASSNALASSCSGGSDGHTCGLDWFKGSWDGVYGLGEQICALDTLTTLLVGTKKGPLTQNDTLVTGDGDAGGNTTRSGLADKKSSLLSLTTGDKAGAGVITVLIILLLLGSSWWMLI